MPALQRQTNDSPVACAPARTGDRAWFLVGSKWEDPVWVLAPGNALEERQPVRLRWDFELQDGRRFTDQHYTALLETSRQLVAFIRSGSLSSGLPLRPSTVAQYFQTLRCLLHWMSGEGSAASRCSTQRRCCSSSSGCARVLWRVVRHSARQVPWDDTCTCWRTSTASATNSTTA